MERDAWYADPVGEVQAKPVTHSERQQLENDHASSVPGCSPSPSTEAIQLVESVDEGNALVKRLRQLESENMSLAAALTKMCDENALLTKYIGEILEKCTALTSNPLAGTSVLHSLFEPEKTGWFGGSKTAARENLEKLSESLQNEFVEYRASHASSNDEVQVLIAELQNAYTSAQQLSLVVREQQEAISRGPLSVSVRVLPPAEGLAESVSVAELRRDAQRRAAREEELLQELRRLRDGQRTAAAETARLQRELHAARGAALAGAGDSFSELERQRHCDEIARLTAAAAELRDALTTQEQLHAIKAAESKALATQLSAAGSKDSGKDSGPKDSGPCVHCGELRRRLDAEIARAESAERDARAFERRLAGAQCDAGRDADAAQLQAQQQQWAIAELERKVQQSVARDQVAQLEEQNESLAHELEIAGMRVRHLEEMLERERGEVNPNGASVSADSNDNTSSGAGTLDEAKVLEMIERNKERVARLEFQCKQLAEEGRRLTETIATKDEELLHAARTTQEDKHRINFLLKRAVDITSELKSSRADCESAVEAHEKAQLEISKLRRQVEEIPILHQRIEEMRQRHEVLEDRLSSVEGVEDKLVKAKETIAYLELAQSKTISMSKYAESQSKNTHLENQLELIKRQLEESKEEVERLKGEIQNFQGVITRQNNQIQTHEESLASLNANDAKVREKCSQLSAENTRLVQLNQALEQQVVNMQDGIKEMAIKLDQERERAKSVAEAQYRGEIQELQQKLATANQTLDDVKASQHLFVPEGIHRSLIAEKERSDEENKRKSFDIDKLKSEIIIYRQTVDDLEAENEEHVRHIERLQATHQKERSTSAERLTAEQKRASEFERELESLRMHVKELSHREELNTAQQRTMIEAAEQHRCAFEEKCQQEAQLTASLEAANIELERLRSELRNQCASFTNASASSSPPPPPFNASSAMGLYSPLLSSPPVSADPAALHASYMEAQQQLGEQRQVTADAATAFAQALDKSEAEAAELRARVRSLEAALAATTDGRDPLDVGAVVPTPRARKKKSAKKGLASLAHVNEGLEEADVLSVAGVGEMNFVRLCAVCVEAQAALACAEQNLVAEREECERLRETIHSISQDLQNAQSDLELATLDVDERTNELQQQIHFLEGQLKATERSPIATDAEARAQTLAEENRRLRAQIDAQEKEKEKEKEKEERGDKEWKWVGCAQPPDSAPLRLNGGGDTIAKLQEELRAKEKELAALARELLPIKNKLVEFMAMADRLGIHYPFSSAMEGAAVLRLRAMHFDSAGRTRASSAPRTRGGDAFMEAKSSDAVRKRRKKREARRDDQSDIR